MATIFSDNESRDIVRDYASGEICAENLDGGRKNYKQEIDSIRTIHGLKNPECTILKYGAIEMKKNLEKERDGAKRFDWDSITYKDENGDLIDLVCDSVSELDYEKKNKIAYKIVDKILENVIKYYSREFEEKVEDAKEWYQQHGSFDYMEV